MKRRIGLVVALGAATIGVALFGLYLRRSAPRPIRELDNVYYTIPEFWTDFYANRLPAGSGWILLPQLSHRTRFKSGVDPSRRGFVRAEVCGECHADKYEGFRATAHFHTSREASAATVLGAFDAQKGRLKTRDPNLHFEMIARDDGLYQRVVVQKNGKRYEHAERIDIVTGSGKQGQTYLYWHDDQLLQLPLSYFSESRGWINSPGMYKDGTADFARPITHRCLDCHSTFFAPASPFEARYDRENYVLGVTCVRCHGAGWAHVQYHRTHRDDQAPRYIVHPGKLPRERANDACAQCHSGVGELIRPAFTYQPGDPLSDYMKPDLAPHDAANDDPHAANQLARLVQSRCYQATDSLTCATCHDPHRHERGDLRLFARRCAECHQSTDCPVSASSASDVKDRCVECHMPSRRDVAGVMQTRQGEQHPLVRDHLIKVWPDVAEQVLKRAGRP